MSSADETDDLPLRGIRVLDFSRVLAGPLCTQSLGDLGAEVIKVESTDIGDETRAWPPFEGEGFGAVFVAVNRNKRSLAVDLKTDAGRALVKRLAAGCDIAIENFSTGVAERLGIDHATLKAANERLIYCSISGFGRHGPLRQAAGYDVILQAFSGMMSLTGEPGGDHIRIPISPIDQVTGLNAFSAILAALIRRGSTGRGAHIEVSLLETATALLNHPLQSFWSRGVQPARFGSSHEALVPYQAFDAADGSVMIGIANDKLWAKFCRVVGLDEALADPRFASNADRAAHRAEVLALVRPVVAARSVEQWVAQLAPIGVPVAPINDLAAMLAHPQTAALGTIFDYRLGNGRAVKGVGQPLSIDGRRAIARRPPPARGEHSWDILAEAGLAADEIAALRDSGVVVGADG
ncbi:MAG: CoA transferase [Novosphingobium sp.]